MATFAIVRAVHMLVAVTIAVLTTGAPAHAQAKQDLPALNRRVYELTTASKYADALPLAQTALALAESMPWSNHREVATPLYNLAILHRRLGKAAEAEPLLRRAIAIIDATSGLIIAMPALCSTHSELSCASRGSMRTPSLPISGLFASPSWALDPSIRTWAPPSTTWSSLYKFLGRPDDAEPMLRRGLELTEKAHGAEKASPC